MELGERMKLYELASKGVLMRRVPVIARLDGRAFHTFTRGFQKPWDEQLHAALQQTAHSVCREVSGTRLAYLQSDEISFLLIDYENLDTEPWFENVIQKMSSVMASMATAAFNAVFRHPEGRLATFDCRVFNVPREDVCNYFIWRQKDAERNSIQGLGQVHFDHTQMQGVKNNTLQDMLFSRHGVNWNDCLTWQKRGSCVRRVWSEDPEAGLWQVDEEIPVFTENRAYVEQYVFPAQ